MKNKMKIVAGMSRLEDYEPYVKAGADEVFIGYVPQAWQQQYGLYTPLNRREVCCCHVQIGAENELRILSDMVRENSVPATIAFNGLHFRPDQFTAIAEIMMQCKDLGFSSVIVADPALLVYLYEAGLTDNYHVHISGEFGEMNRYAVRELSNLGAERLIFHRKISIPEMRKIISDDNGVNQYEAFLLNEMCHFHGGYCASLHCDELVPMCRMPYIVSGDDIPASAELQSDPNSLGAGGCGLCALWKLREAGVTHLKIVGRGAHSDNMLRDISAVRLALGVLYDAADESDYMLQMKKELFPEGCSSRCYYGLDAVIE